MHELGIVYEVIKVVDNFVEENNLNKVEKIVLEIGKLSGVYTRFIEECYPAAIDETAYVETELEIVEIPAIVRCNSCGQSYDVMESHKVCPKCSKTEYTMITGQEFNIREIVAY